MSLSKILLKFIRRNKCLSIKFVPKKGQFITKFVPKKGQIIIKTDPKKRQLIENSYVVKDDIEYAYSNVIPLWEFGLNY